MATELRLEQGVDGEPGDEFTFNSTSSRTQYHFQVDGAGPKVVVSLWGPNNPNAGKARSKPGKNYVDRTLPTGQYVVRVKKDTRVPMEFDEVDHPYIISVTKNSWWKKVFG